MEAEAEAMEAEAEATEAEAEVEEGPNATAANNPAICSASAHTHHQMEANELPSQCNLRRSI